VCSDLAVPRHHTRSIAYDGAKSLWRKFLHQRTYALLSFYLALNTACSMPQQTVVQAAPAIAPAATANIALDNRDHANKLFAEAVDIAQHLKSSNLQYEALLDIATQMTQVGEKAQALKILTLAEAKVRNDADALSKIALQTAKLGEQRRASTLFTQAIALELNNLRQTKDKDTIYFNEKTLVAVIEKMAEAGHFELALTSAPKVSDPLRQAEAFNAIATQLIARGKIEEAQAPLSEALNIAQHISDEDISYSYMSNGSCVNYKFEVLSNIAQNLSLLGQLERALTVATSTRGCRSASGDEEQAYRVWAYSGILKPLKNPKLVQKAWQSVQTIPPEDRDRADVWGVIAIKLAEVHETALAYDVAQKINKIEFFEGLRNPISLSAKEELLQTIAIKLAEGGALENAQVLIKTLRPSGIELETQAITALEIVDKLDPRSQAQLRQTLFSHALELTQITIKQKNIKSQIDDRQRAFRGDLAKRLTQHGQLKTALALANAIAPPSHKAFILSQIALALAETGSVAQALKLLPSIEDAQLKDSTRSGIAAALGTAGNSQQALDVAQTIQERFNLLESLPKIIPQLKDKRQVETALLMIHARRFKRSSTSISQEQKDGILAALATQFVEIGEIASGIQIAKTSGRAAVMTGIAKALVKRGNVEEGLQLLASLTERNADSAKAIAEIARDLIKKATSPKANTTSGPQQNTYKPSTQYFKIS
jgi:hypothetical protein